MNDVGDDESTLSDGGASFQPLAPRIPRVVLAGTELDFLRQNENAAHNDRRPLAYGGYPPKSLPVVRLLAGNHCCVDCGNDQFDMVHYGSVGYGTLLCKECAYRHSMNTGEDSLIKSLFDDDWSLRESMCLLEGGNTRMLEFLKTKPKWKPPKGEKESDPEDVAAFKQIYLSKGAATYRRMLEKRTEDAHGYQTRAAWVADSEADRAKAKAKGGGSGGVAGNDEVGPFDHIFESMNIPRERVDQISGFKSGGKGKRGGRHQHAKAPKRRSDSPTFDEIKERIETRRIQTTDPRDGPDRPTEDSYGAGGEGGPYSHGPQNGGQRDFMGGGDFGMGGSGPTPPPRQVQQQQQHQPRRGNDFGRFLVGEISEFSIDDQQTVGGSTVASSVYGRGRGPNVPNFANNLVGEDDKPVEPMRGARQAHRRRGGGRDPSTYAAPLGTYQRSDSSGGRPDQRPTVHTGNRRRDQQAAAGNNVPPTPGPTGRSAYRRPQQ